MKKIVWLASYPKSGNTWFRIFLSNLLTNSETPFSINSTYCPIASNRRYFDSFTGAFSSDLGPAEINRLRPYLYRYIAENANETIFMKIHDACFLTDEGIPLIPAEATAAVIYLIRNPLDVAVSYAFHFNKSIDKTIADMANSNPFSGIQFDISEQLPVFFTSWSEHVKSWTMDNELKVHVIRYEDLRQNDISVFEAAVRFLNLPYSNAQVEKAAIHSRFTELRKQETQDGFNEKLYCATSFFRKGEVGNWRNHLNPNQVEQIIKNHKEVMIKYKYLDHNERPVF